MNEPIENKYFNWLCAKVLEVNTEYYYPLMEILFNKEFVWVVPADKHRAEDVIDLRLDFFRESFTKKDPTITTRMPSLLEVFIAFAKRASFQTGAAVMDWFWEFMANLNLDQFNHILESDIPIIEEILYTFTWRIYDPSGLGGMFPMNHTKRDQTKLEIWYQFCEYLDDRGLV